MSAPPLAFANTAAMLTPRGRGAVATVRFCGDVRLIDTTAPPLFRTANGRALADQSLGALRFGHWGLETREEAVVCRRDAATIEIHCHGGEAAAGRILSDLRALGCPSVSWIDQVAAEHGPLAAECCEALSQAATVRTAEILLHQQAGVLRAAFESLARIPHCGNTGEADALGRIDELLSWSEFGLHLTRPWQVVLTGRPNVGKSSLINALLGYPRSIVYDEPGTTRDVVTAETAFAGWPVQLADTAGYRESSDAIEAAGIALARARLDTADCRIIVLDIGRSPEPADFELMRAWPDAVVVAHKCDLPDRWGSAAPREALRVSSMTNVGVEALADAVAARLVPRTPDAFTAIPLSDRQIGLLRATRSAFVAGDDRRARELVDKLLA